MKISSSNLRKLIQEELFYREFYQPLSEAPGISSDPMGALGVALENALMEAQKASAALRGTPKGQEVEDIALELEGFLEILTGI